MTKRLHNEADVAYRKVNYQWLKFHYHVLILCVFISAILELLIYFILRFTSTMHLSDWNYCLKYIITPVGVGFLFSLFAFVVVRMKHLRVRVKIYAVSTLLMLIAVNLSFIHSGYHAALFCFLLPIMMTIMYEDQKLTLFISICTIPLEVWIALTKLWDPYKEITHGYIINTIILVILTIVTWMISYYMIRFSLLKKEVVIQRDMERQQLKERILLDELTNVGTKQALLLHLNSLETKGENFHLAMLDLDNFKSINDQNGHLFGDEVLKCLGIALNTMCDQCYSYRYGGDEFSIIIMKHQKQQIIKDLRYLQNDFHNCLMESKRNITIDITMSIGVALHHDEMTCVELMKSADAALYESKEQGRNIITYRE